MSFLKQIVLRPYILFIYFLLLLQKLFIFVLMLHLRLKYTFFVSVYLDFRFIDSKLLNNFKQR